MSAQQRVCLHDWFVICAAKLYAAIGGDRGAVVAMPVGFDVHPRPPARTHAAGPDPTLLYAACLQSDVLSAVMHLLCTYCRYDVGG